MNIIAGEYQAIECIQCLNCLECKNVRLLSLREKREIPFPMKESALSRRQLIYSLISGIVIFSGLKVIIKKRRPKFFVLRPLGSIKNQEEFNSRCIRCGDCINICPTGGLWFSLFEAGISGIFTPIFIPKLGPCEPYCNLCTTVCPTKAIEYIPLSEKKKIKIGKAIINKKLCLVYKYKTICYVCVEVCPYQAACKIKEGILINEESCIGCGVCEYNCPAEAIKVYPTF
jgi:ferredoxin